MNPDIFFVYVDIYLCNNLFFTGIFNIFVL